MVEIMIFSIFPIIILGSIGLGAYAMVKEYQVKQKKLDIEMMKLENEAFLLIEKKHVLLEETKDGPKT
ncbi:hypothetical protein PB01_00690 [Psychrobacillus glaciei]|uniref:Uncharacterized protein n=1 Tax=Psychrobacillus glaciei TaxID=2283160 RepID=A0A5J6SHS0_9BACI|nr:hypothetical protein [Psychrobacillus glaciei]QFF97446.1 hypothetical protein PB01_00690 [Psychrobacillus glaciei]